MVRHKNLSNIHFIKSQCHKQFYSSYVKLKDLWLDIQSHGTSFNQSCVAQNGLHHCSQRKKCFRVDGQLTEDPSLQVKKSFTWDFFEDKSSLWLKIEVMLPGWPEYDFCTLPFEQKSVLKNIGKLSIVFSLC